MFPITHPPARTMGTPIQITGTSTSLSLSPRSGQQSVLPCTASHERGAFATVLQSRFFLGVIEILIKMTRCYYSAEYGRFLTRHAANTCIATHYWLACSTPVRSTETLLISNGFIQHLIVAMLGLWPYNPAIGNCLERFN